MKWTNLELHDSRTLLNNTYLIHDPGCSAIIFTSIINSQFYLGMLKKCSRKTTLVFHRRRPTLHTFVGDSSSLSLIDHPIQSYEIIKSYKLNLSFVGESIKSFSIGPPNSGLWTSLRVHDSTSTPVLGMRLVLASLHGFEPHSPRRIKDHPSVQSLRQWIS